MGYSSTPSARIGVTGSMGWFDMVTANEIKKKQGAPAG